MENQLLGGVAANEFIDLNFEGVMNLGGTREMTCALGRCWIAVPRDGYEDMPDIGGISGNDKSAGAVLGVLVIVGTPDERFEEVKISEISSYMSKIPFSQEEQLFDNLAHRHPVGSLVAARTKVYNADFATRLQAIGVISAEYAEKYRVCTAEIFDIYSSFPFGTKAPADE